MNSKLCKSLVLVVLTAAVVLPAQAKRIMARPDGSAAAPASLCDMSVSSGQTGSTGPDDLANTRWNIKYKADGEDARNYEFRLLPGGRMLNNHPNDKTMDNDAWESKGRYLMLRFNNSFVVYTGVLNKQGDAINGHAVNRGGDSWAWNARRLPPCSATRN